MADTYIKGTAIITPVGLHTAQTCASVRSGIMRFAQLPWKDKKYDPFVMATLPDGCLPLIDTEEKECIPFGDRGLRMLRLVGALQEELAPIVPEQEIPLVVGLAQNDKLSIEVTEGYLRQMAAVSKINIDQSLSRLIAKGRASGILAIIEAMKILESGSARAVLAGGCDTYKDPELLGALDVETRLKSETNRDGFIPGEGAGLLLLTNHPPQKSQGATGYRITATATGFEPGHIHSKAPYRGKGLSQTFKSLFKDFTQKIGTVYSTMNGESYWGKEWGVASIRYKDHFAEDHGFEHPADCYGDLGGAAGPVMTALAMGGLANNYNKAPVLIYASSDDGERAAIIIDNVQS
ncbi:MAG: hypothetical protein JEZ12_23280 [Desulfobacterium sp.]|nr:hypothetical protein [Desulfobacterium sp.]